jgi:hypothetical protein
MKSRWHVPLILAALGWAQPGFTQAPPYEAPNPYGTANRAVQIEQARQRNAALTHQFMWNSRVEIIKAGQVKDIRIEQESFGPTGQIQSIVLNNQPESSGLILPTPFGFLRRAIAENEKQELETYLKGLKGLLQQYTLPTTGKSSTFSRRPCLPARTRTACSS